MRATPIYFSYLEKQVGSLDVWKKIAMMMGMADKLVVTELI